MKRFLAIIPIAIGAVLIAAPANAEQPPNEGVCEGLDSGKIDVDDDVDEITITAPEGQLIVRYCVKAGSIIQGDGPEYVDVDPPQESVTFSHSTGKDISHYSVEYGTAPPPTTTPTTTPPTTTPPTTVPPTTTPPTDTTVPGTPPPDDDHPTPPTTVTPPPDELPNTGIGIAPLVGGAALIAGSAITLLRGRRRSE